MRPRFNRRADPGVAPPREREAKDVRRTDDYLKLYEARIASHGSAGLAEWLAASPIPGADETSRVCILMRINRVIDIAERQRCRDLLR